MNAEQLQLINDEASKCGYCLRPLIERNDHRGTHYQCPRCGPILDAGPPDDQSPRRRKDDKPTDSYERAVLWFYDFQRQAWKDRIR